MNKKVRTSVAAASMGVCLASFGTRMWLFLGYFSSRPKQPHPELGLMHAFNNHGSYVYSSAAESTGVALLMTTFFIGFVLAFAITPKKPLLPPAGTPRWLTYVGGAANIDLGGSALWRLHLIMLCSAALSLIVIFLAGRPLADFFVSGGVIL